MNEFEVFSERETNMFMLDSYPSDIHNVLDAPVNKLIVSIEEKIYECSKRYAELEKQDRKEEAKYRKLNKFRSYDNEIQVNMFGLIEDIKWMEDELTALYEIKIIYAFKHLEVHLKQLLSMGYEEEFNAKTYKWENIIQFLNSKNIDLKSVKEYTGVNELRIINNSIKHSGIIDTTINIKEFREKDIYYYSDLKRFYSRIEKLPIKFITALKARIIKERYEFSGDRIKSIARSFQYRMTKEQATKLSAELVRWD